MNRLLISSLAAISLHGLLFFGTFTDSVMIQPRPLSFQKINISLSPSINPVSRENTTTPEEVKNEKQVHPPVKEESRMVPPELPRPIPAEKETPALRPVKQKKLVEHVIDESPLDIPEKLEAEPTENRNNIEEKVTARHKTPSEKKESPPEQSASAASRVVQEAVPLQHINKPPAYPRAARRRGMEGLVEINVLVDRQGKVKKQQIHQSSGYTLLDRAALKAVKKWSFDPGVKNGTLCEMWVKVPVRFQLINK